MKQTTDLWGLQQLLQTFTEITLQQQKVMQSLLIQRQEKFNLHLDMFIQSWQEFSLRALSNPDKLMMSQIKYWQYYLGLCNQISQNAYEETKKSDQYNTTTNLIDKRFQHEEWEKNYLFSLIKQSYLLMSQHMQAFVKEISEETEDKPTQRLEFFTQQFINAISPSNFVTTNPEILKATLNSKGKNLIQGFQQFLNDIENGHGLLSVKTTDLNFFELGKNIATTSGKVVFQNDIMQLIQYDPITAKVYQKPLLIIPPWINKYYIFDLQPESSFVRWLTEREQTVFLISWVNPDKSYANKQFSDYLIEGPLTALKVIARITGEEQANVLGYCIGGTLLACLLAYLSAQNIYQISSATFLTTLLDFSSPGELGVFIDEKQVTALEKNMASKGYLDGNIMMSIFSLLRSNDLVWKSYVNHYLKGEKPIPFDFLHWNSDPTNIPEKVHSFYLREMYLNNNLIKPNAIRFKDVPINLKNILTPSYFLAAFDDHIVPWQSCYQGLQFIGGDKTFVLADSGHVAGVINSPVKNKYGYRTNQQLPNDAETWLQNSNHFQGSWWTNWLHWLTTQFAGEKVPPRIINPLSMEIIEDAPGSYVRTRINHDPKNKLGPVVN